MSREILTVGRKYKTGTVQIVANIHSPTLCEGRPCPIHNPTNHSMRDLPTHFRDDRVLMERICPHGIGHPDPDDLWYKENVLKLTHEGIHGCDGCCR